MKHLLANTVRCATPICLAACLVIHLAGCRGEPDYGLSGNKQFDQINEYVKDSASRATADPIRFVTFFVEGAAPEGAQREAYGSFVMEPQGDPRIEGNAAKVTVLFRDRANYDASVSLGELEWTLEKPGDVWLLKDTPLPSR